MVDAHYRQQLHTFFETMASYLTAKDAIALTSHYHLPTVFVNEGTKQICADKDEVETKLKGVMDTPRFRSAAKFEFTMVQAIKLSDALYFVQLAWVWKDGDGQTVLNRVTSYTLQEVNEAHFDIVVSVADDSALISAEL